MKVLILDSGPLINLSMNGLLYLLEELKKKFNGKFMITSAVKYEVIEHPLNIQRFELGAIKIKNLLEKGIIELPESIGINEEIIRKETEKLMNAANHYLQSRGKWIKLVSEAEISCLALSTELSKGGVENMIAIDERTTRMLGEKPENLGKIMSEKLHQRVDSITSDITPFSDYKFIRSSEIVYAAYKKNLVGLAGKNVLEALLYATKFHGAAISFEEIETLKKL